MAEQQTVTVQTMQGRIIRAPRNQFLVTSWGILAYVADEDITEVLGWPQIEKMTVSGRALDIEGS